MSWKTIIIGCESNVSLSTNRMKITIGGDYHYVPLNDLDNVFFSHNKTVITIPLLVELLKHNVNVVICDSKNDPIGTFNSFNNHSLVFKQLNKQLNWKLTRKKKLWKLIIEDKIQSEIDVLKLLGLDERVIKQLKEYKESVYTNDQSNREGICARIYFIELFGKEFNRDDFNQTNLALNYGYKVLASYITKCIVSRGLLPQLGIHHIGESNPFNLTYDFIEAMRSIVDSWVYAHIDDLFTSIKKKELIELLDAKVFVSGRYLRLSDAIMDIIDSYIQFLDEKKDTIKRVDLSKGIRFDED